MSVFSSLRLITLVAIPACALLATAGPAAAQASNASKVGGPVVPLPDVKNRQLAPPPAVPGARSAGAPVSEPDRPPSEMAPTEALFDAINRGDPAGARDAIARGADLGDRNILGLTPVDLSVDLGRNEITFLLLSMRGAAPSNNTPEPRRAAAPPARGRNQVAARPAETRQVVRAAAPRGETAANRQYVNRDPGTPAPQSGFLGFGGAPTH